MAATKDSENGGSTAVNGNDSDIGKLEQAIQEAMTKLMNVSSSFKDLQPGGADAVPSTRESTIDMMNHYLRRLQLEDTVQNKLSVIHIAGTKGKGSTCAMVERILRDAGYKTGLFTSPHLISPCERFRINGKPIAERLFVESFEKVWDGLERTQHLSGEHPPMAWFFRFMTLLALHIFVDEDVDVAILEVGIGGRLDATNVITRPVVCGVTTLDLDHTQILGETLPEIAYAKAGIFKPNVPAFCVPQEPSAMDKIRECAKETQTPLYEIPTLDGLGPNGRDLQLGMQGDYQRSNAALAAFLASAWLAHKSGEERGKVDCSQVLTPPIRHGLQKAFWPGRAQSVVDPTASNIAYHIDGAHTFRSLECCAEWYRSVTGASGKRRKALVFTIHHERNVAKLLQPLLPLGFDRVYFCPTKASRPSKVTEHTFSGALSAAGLDEIVAKYSEQEVAQLDDVADAGRVRWQTTLARVWTALHRHFNNTSEKEEMEEGDGVETGHKQKQFVSVKGNVVDCIKELRRLEEERGWDVVITGSLYLAGETLSFLQWQE